MGQWYRQELTKLKVVSSSDSGTTVQTRTKVVQLRDIV